MGDDRKVQGFCPMGCGETLFLAAAGHVTCSYRPCPNPNVGTLIARLRAAEAVCDSCVMLEQRRPHFLAVQQYFDRDALVKWKETKDA